MDTGNVILLIIAAIAILVIVARTVIAIIFANSPVLKSPLFRVYRNSTYNPKAKYGPSSVLYEYRCILSKMAIEKFGDLSIVGFGDTIEDAYEDAKTQLNNYLIENKLIEGNV